MGEKLHSPADVQKTLNGTVCRFKGEPVYVEADGISDVVRVQALGQGNAERLNVLHTDPEFDYSAPLLGYVYFGESDNCYYLRRKPNRQWSAGITHRAVANASSAWFYTKQVADCISGKYPGYEEALELVLSSKATKVPFHRYYAVAREKRRVVLLHRENLIGYYSTALGKFSLLPDGGTSLVFADLKKKKLDHIATF